MVDRVTIGSIPHVPPDGAPPAPEAPERPEWCPEKFWDGKAVNSQALATSYAELEKVVTSKTPPTPPKPAEGDKKAPDAGPWSQENITKWSKAAAENGGVLPDEVYNEIPVPRPFVDMWIQAMQGQAKASVESDYEVVGGEEAWGQIRDWAKDAYTAEEKEAFETAMQNGGELKNMALRQIRARYEEAEGKPAGRRVKGELTGKTSDAFKSKEQMFEAMRDPRYKFDSGRYDPAYAADVRRRVALMK